MAKYVFDVATWTPTAVADTTNYTANGFMAVQGVASTRVLFYEVYMGGQAGASSPSIMVVSRDSTVGGTITGLSAGQTMALLDATAQAPAATATSFVAATTEPQRSSTLHLINVSFNAFGGIIRWVAAPGEEFSTYGATASLGEVSLSAYTGGTPGLMGAHFIFEP